MIYAGGQIVDLNTVKLPDGSFYDGKDEIKLLLAKAWMELQYSFFDKYLPVIFKTPSIRSGHGKGNMGYSYPRSVFYKTNKGRVLVAWCDSAENENGKIKYLPVLKRISLNEKTLTLNENDIEEILFMYLFNPNVISPTNPTGKTYLEDKEAEALKYEETETDAAVISYWLYRKESPFYNNEVKISTLCLAWGINPDKKSITYRKQLLAEAVKRSEKKNDREFDLKAFNAICEKFKEGQDTGDIDIMALIQKCLINKVIKFDQDKLIWVLLGIEGNTLKTICKVPPQLINTNRNVLKKHLLGNPDDVQTLNSSLVEDQPVMGHDFCILTEELPEEVTMEYIQNEMSWPTKKAVYKFLGHDPRNKTMDQIQPILIEYFVVQDKQIPWKLKDK